MSSTELSSIFDAIPLKTIPATTLLSARLTYRETKRRNPGTVSGLFFSTTITSEVFRIEKVTLLPSGTLSPVLAVFSIYMRGVLCWTIKNYLWFPVDSFLALFLTWFIRLFAKRENWFRKWKSLSKALRRWLRSQTGSRRTHQQITKYNAPVEGFFNRGIYS